MGGRASLLEDFAIPRISLFATDLERRRRDALGLANFSPGQVQLKSLRA